MADLHASPYESKEVNSARASYQQGRLKVERMEKELDRVTDAAMAYKSVWTKSASQMAREAMEACEMEAASSKKVDRLLQASQKCSFILFLAKLGRFDFKAN